MVEICVGTTENVRLQSVCTAKFHVERLVKHLDSTRKGNGLVGGIFGTGHRLIPTSLLLPTQDRQREMAILMSPPCLESQGCQFDPTFL